MLGKPPTLPPTLPGERYGWLRILNVVGKVLLCECDCGTVKCLDRYKVISGHTKSCGCYRSQIRAADNFKHGGVHLMAYNRWQSMIRRCYRPSSHDYQHYGGRGITVCDRWQQFAGFYADMGDPPTPKHYLDRWPDNNGNYEPGNCRWATTAQSARNRRSVLQITYRGQTQCLRDWVNQLGLQYGTCLYRLRHGHPLEQVFLPGPIHHLRQRKINNT